jgi:hypothetical protein
MALAKPDPARRIVDVSDVDGVLAGFETRHDDDGETQLICTGCGRRVCYVDNDPVDTLVRLCLDHEHEEDTNG